MMTWLPCQVSVDIVKVSCTLLSSRLHGNNRGLSPTPALEHDPMSAIEPRKRLNTRSQTWIVIGLLTSLSAAYLVYDIVQTNRLRAAQRAERVAKYQADEAEFERSVQGRGRLQDLRGLRMWREFNWPRYAILSTMPIRWRRGGVCAGSLR